MLAMLQRLPNESAFAKIWFEAVKSGGSWYDPQRRVFNCSCRAQRAVLVTVIGGVSLGSEALRLVRASIRFCSSTVRCASVCR